MNGGRGMNKSLSERIHSKRRFAERFGCGLNRHEYKNVIDNIKDRKYKLLEKQNRIAIYEGEVKGNTTKIIYDRTRKEIVTFLTKEMLI